MELPVGRVRTTGRLVDIVLRRSASPLGRVNGYASGTESTVVDDALSNRSKVYDFSAA